MKVYGVCVHGKSTVEIGRTGEFTRSELQYGIPDGWKLFSNIEDAKKYRQEIIAKWSERWDVKSEIDDTIFMRSKRFPEDSVMGFTICEFFLDE